MIWRVLFIAPWVLCIGSLIVLCLAQANEKIRLEQEFLEFQRAMRKWVGE